MDDTLQICEADVDNYNIGLSEKLMNHLNLHFNIIDILIIGGGDGFLTYHLLKNYPNINSITVIELDEDVINLVNKHFRMCENIFDNNKVTLKIMSGELYVEECIKNNKKFNGIIVDCTDYDINCPSIVLFSEKFYSDVKEILFNNGYLTQQFDTIDTLVSNVDGNFQLSYPKLDISNKYHFEHVNCFSYGAPTYMLHSINKKTICINGAGITGLILAKLLKENNYNVDLYEKSDKLGGRFGSKLVDNENILTGAEYVHGKKSLMYKLIEEYDLTHELIEINCISITDINLQVCNQKDASNTINNLSDFEKIVLICHEFCMDLDNLDNDSIDIENENWICGEENYLMNNKIYSTIINDLKKYPDNLYLLTENIDKKYDYVVNTFAPDYFIKNNHPAIKIFFKTNQIDWNKTQSVLYGKKIMNIDVTEIWKNENIFVLFATASRAKILNNLSNKDKQLYIELVMSDILNQNDIKINIVDVFYHEYGYHYPCKKIVPENYCGEWTSQIYDSSLSGAIKSAYDMLDHIKQYV